MPKLYILLDMGRLSPYTKTINRGGGDLWICVC